METFYIHWSANVLFWFSWCSHGSGCTLCVCNEQHKSISKCQSVSLRSYTLHMPTSWVQGLHFLVILDNTFFSFSYEYIYPTSVKCGMSVMVFICVLPMVVMLSIFSCVFIGHLHIVFGELPHQIICPFFSYFVFLLLDCKSSLYILDTSLLSDIWFANIFTHSVGLSSYFLQQALFLALVKFWFPELPAKLSKCLKLWNNLKFF